jgi:hypothetical protein
MELLLAFMFAVGMWNLRHFLNEAVRKRNDHEQWMRYSSMPPTPEHRDPYLEHERRKQVAR